MRMHSDDDDAFAYGNMRAGFDMRVRWVKLLRAELERLREAHPEEAERIDTVLSQTHEWL